VCVRERERERQRERDRERETERETERERERERQTERCDFLRADVEREHGAAARPRIRTDTHAAARARRARRARGKEQRAVIPPRGLRRRAFQKSTRPGKVDAGAPAAGDEARDP
jgi:hypothetical protein